jgi:hypothetical protein
MFEFGMKVEDDPGQLVCRRRDRLRRAVVTAIAVRSLAAIDIILGLVVADKGYGRQRVAGLADARRIAPELFAVLDRLAKEVIDWQRTNSPLPLGNGRSIDCNCLAANPIGLLSSNVLAPVFDPPEAGC